MSMIVEAQTETPIDVSNRGQTAWERARKDGDYPQVFGRTSPDFLEQYFGIFADDPTFDELVRFSEERRERERAEANREADEWEAAQRHRQGATIDSISADKIFCL